jgi:hypothetical protein
MTLAHNFHTLFLGLERAHGLWKNGEKDANNKQKGSANTAYKPVTDKLWQQHLDGTIGIGIVPINDDSQCWWGAIDIDSYDGLDHIGLEQQILKLEIPLVVLRSKSGGAHLYLFTSEPVPAKLMQQRLKECALALGQPKAEVFPKQAKLAAESDVGNWINMPYQSHERTVRYCIHGGKALTAEKFLEVAEAQRVTKMELNELKPKAAVGEDFSEAPPCIQYLVAHGFPEGSRNNALLSLGLYAKKRFEDGEWQEKVMEYNNRWMSGTWGEVNGVIRSVTKKDYVYKCKDQPLCNHCNRPVCYDREYGINDGKGAPNKNKRKEDNGPCVLDSVDRPVKVYRPAELSHDEPQWTFSIAGKKLDVSMEMLMDQSKFLRAYTARFERLMIPVQYPRWVAAMNEILAEAEPFELPPDAGPEGQLLLHLEAFCTGKAQARDKNELLLGRPWTDEERITWFRSRDFLKYCDQQHFRNYREKEMFAVFRRNGGTNRKFMLKGKCVAGWGFPAFQQQTEEFDHVEIPTGDEGGQY